MTWPTWRKWKWKKSSLPEPDLNSTAGVLPPLAEKVKVQKRKKKEI